LTAFLSTIDSAAQNILPIGGWRSHLPIRTGKFVTQSEEKIYYATNQAILAIDKEELSSEFITTVEGLSNVGIELIRYNKDSEVLIIVYNNTVIDLLYEDNTVTTLNQIRNFDFAAGEKAVNDLYIENDSIVYLAASYGVSKLNIAAQEFLFTTFFTGIPVESVFINEGFIYAATDEGIYRTETDNINPDDFGNWTFLGTEFGFPSDYSAQAFAVYEGEFHLTVNDTLYTYSDNELTFKHYEEGSIIEYLSTDGRHLLAGYRPGRVVAFDPAGTLSTLPSNCVRLPTYAIEDEQGRIWFGNEQVRSTFRYLSDINAGFCEALEFETPWSESVWDIAIRNNELWMASGGLDQTGSARFLSDGFASLIDGNWTIYNRENTEALKGPDPQQGATDDDVQDFISAAIHPGNGTVYMGSFLEGLIERMPDGNINHYLDTNSTLQAAIGDDQRVRVGGLDFDDENNLWISNNSTSEPLSVLMPDGTFKSFAMPNSTQNEVLDLTVDGSGYKWMILSNTGAALMLFDEGEMMSTEDDLCRVFTANNSELPTNSVNCVITDLEGDVWVGTSEGITIFECGSSAFEPECLGTRRIVEQDGFGAFLLETENVNTIAIDGANRKWVGTNNGIFLLSANGEEQVARFTTENSPIYSNNILEIEVNRQTGEVFIGTVEGLISYQSDAVSGGQVHKADLTVYPNPVRPEYDGPIAIKGLARDATVKITDISGQLVFETTALGGQAIWNGQDYNGRRVASGVYLVFSSSNPRFSGFTGTADAAVAKILVLN
jgi:sugar lactone lactonase YvrE